MPEIGFWKYVRFTDDEPLFFGTDDDIVQIFDSADDRMEYRMKKDIRFEDDVGNEILTLDKVNRHVKIPMQLNVAALEEYAAGAGISVNATMTFASGSNLNLNNNLLQNPKLGTDFLTNGYSIFHGVADTGVLALAGGSTTSDANGAIAHMYGRAHASYPGRMIIRAGRVNHWWARIEFNTADTLEATKTRLLINQGDDPDIDIMDAKLDFHDQTLEATAGAIAGYFRLKVGGAEYKVPAYALT